MIYVLLCSIFFPPSTVLNTHDVAFDVMASFKTYYEQWRDTRLSNSPGRVGVLRMF